MSKTNFPSMQKHAKSLLKIHLLIVIFLSSCQSKTSAEAIKAETQSVSSWAATAHMIADAWIRGTVPSNYARNTLKQAEKELQKEIGNIEKIKISTDANQRDKLFLLTRITQLVDKTRKMSMAVAEENKMVMRQQLQEFAVQEQSLNVIKNNSRANQ